MPIARTADPSRATFEHTVDLYATSGELAGRVADYLRGALDHDGAAIVVATAAHRDAIAGALEGLGVDVGAARRESTLIELDAATTLQRISGDGNVDRADFTRVIGGLVRDAYGDGRVVRVYGEMVALLWADGLVAGALELETRWNELAGQTEFSLYCAYPQHLLDDAAQVTEMCGLHTHVTGAARPTMPAVAHRGTMRTGRRFDATVDAPGAARQFVREALGEIADDHAVGDATLVVSELVTNAVCHARSSSDVIVSTDATTIRIEVRDHGTAPPLLGSSPPDATSGRGLTLVAALAEAWGHHTDADGKTVWVELRLRVAPVLAAAVERL